MDAFEIYVSVIFTLGVAALIWLLEWSIPAKLREIASETALEAIEKLKELKIDGVEAREIHADRIEAREIHAREQIIVGEKPHKDLQQKQH